MNRNQDQLRLDLFAVRYLEAMERGDLDTIADLWATAAADPELESLLHKLNEELALAPVARRRLVWIGVAAVAAAACVAAVIWAASVRRGTKTETVDGSIHPLPVAPAPSPLAPGSAPAATASYASRLALLSGDLKDAEMPTFAWPFAELPIVRGSSPIPAELLN